MTSAPDIDGGGLQGVYKASPEDFVVSEVLPFRPEGQGEHVYLAICKRGHNTRDLQQSLARLAGIPRHKVGYAGLKDRQAVTRQWFSVHLPGVEEPDWRVLETQGIAIEEISRHRRKLRVGAHRGNQFRIVLRDVAGARASYQQRLQTLSRCGFPNFFGEQRFGRGGSNLRNVNELGPVRKGRLSNKQSMALSAARAFLFNQVLTQRVQRGIWDRAIPGDLINLDGSNSFFGPIESAAELAPRLLAMEIHPTGPLPGTGDTAPAGEALVLEQAVMAEQPGVLNVIEGLRARSARRALRARVEGLQWEWLDQRVLQLEFTLASGVYASSLLAALGQFSHGGRELRGESVPGERSIEGRVPQP